VLRTALRPRWLGLFALLVVVIVTFGRLGLWQLNVAQDQGRAEALAQAQAAEAANLDAIISPHEAFPADGSGRAVIARGTYAADGRLLVGPRRLDGRSGWWVVVPFVVEETGARIAVVRGFVGDPTTPADTPQGQVELRGTLAPGESPAEAPQGLPVRPQEALGSIDLAVLVNRWPGELYNAFVFATGEQSGGQPVALQPGLLRVPPPEVTGGLKWRNAAYALQWWIFAAFAAYMWFRMVRDDAERQGDDTTGVDA
jgi:cytochrome oxidase assembly protein ShyY1